VTRSRTAAEKKRSDRWPPRRVQLERLVGEAVVDAYNESEQRGGLFTMIEDDLALPLDTEVFGVPVTVERVDLTEGNEVVAICRHGRNRSGSPSSTCRCPAHVPMAPSGSRRIGTGHAAGQRK
jgi:hypothetical protein